MINQMHLDRDPLEALVIPTTTVVMGEIPNIVGFPNTKEGIEYRIKSQVSDIPQALLKLKDFVLKFIQTEHGVQDVTNKKKNKFVHTLILTLEFMVKQGFYSDQAQLNSIALPLLMLLDGTDDVYESKDGSEPDPTARYKYT